MNRLDQYTYLAGLVLVCGGLITLGAMAGVRVGFAVMVSTIDCQLATLGAASPCQQAAAEMNQLTKVLAAGGIITMLAGGTVLWQVQNTAVADG